MAINLVWRLVAGVMMAGGYYLVLRHFLKKPWIAALASAILLCDIGTASGAVLAGQFLALPATLATPTGSAFQRGTGPVPVLADRHAALGFAYALGYLWLLSRALDRPGWRRDGRWGPAWACSSTSTSTTAVPRGSA